MTRTIGDNLSIVGALDTTGDVGIGLTSPQGKLHVYDGTTDWLYVSKIGVVGSTQTILPAGTVGEVVEIDGFATNGVNTVVSINVFALDDDNNHFVSGDGGVNQINFICTSAGALTVVRSAGSATWVLSLRLTWQ